MILTLTQENAVNRLIEAYLDHDNDRIICFKAPVGSGKTFMISEFTTRIFEIEASQPQKTIIVFLTISTAHLPKQLANKLNEYKQFHRGNFVDYEIKFIDYSNEKNRRMENLEEFELKDNKIFVLGISAFSRNTLFFQNEALDSFLSEIKLNNYKLIFIRDEAHGEEVPKNVDVKSVTEKLYDAAYFSIEMSDMPRRTKQIIEITSNELENNDGDKCMLKSVNAIQDLTIQINDWEKKLNKRKKNSLEEEELIDFVIWKFKKSQKEYQDLNLQIRPALLIQVKNRIQKAEEEFKQCLELVEKKLNQNNLKYLIYFDNDKRIGRIKDTYNLPVSLKYASKNNSEIDVIIFETELVSGWDIPRANTLLQLKNMQSETLTLQTLGRIKRNPHPELKCERITSKYYVYYLKHLPTKDFILYKLEEEFRGKKLLKGEIVVNKEKQEECFLQYKKKVEKYIRSKEFMKKLNKHIKNINVYNKNFKVINKITIKNEISLKIKNCETEYSHGKILHLKGFHNALGKLKTEKGLEIRKFWLYQSKNKLYSYLTEALITKSDDDRYIIKESEEIPETYPLSNKREIMYDITDIDKYGYIPCTENEEKYQYLDSQPEKSFLHNFKKHVLSKPNVNVDFFTKMAPLTGIYFQYRSKKRSKIKKSYPDYVIECKNKIIMVEVKSGNNDPDKEKTSSLLNAYEKYMLSNKKTNAIEKQLRLVVYWFNSKNKSNPHKFIYWDENGKQIEKFTFQEAFKNLLDLKE